MSIYLGNPKSTQSGHAMIASGTSLLLRTRRQISSNSTPHLDTLDTDAHATKAAWNFQQGPAFQASLRQGPQRLGF